MRARRDQSITGHGHSLAMSAAESGMSPAAALTERFSGLHGVRHTRRLEQSLRDATGLDELCSRLQALHDHLRAAPRQLLLIADPEHSAELVTAQSDAWTGPAGTTGAAARFAPVRERRLQVWQASTQVSFCAMACPTVPVEHPDAAALTVLGPLLRNGYLHRAIREQGGAYGGGASQDSANACFRFFSYRDPRHVATLRDFAASIAWLGDSRPDERAVEEAILGVIGSLDKPGSPAGEAKQQFHGGLFGRSVEQRRRFRQRVIDVTFDDLQRVARQYLDPETASYAVLTNREAAAELEASELLNGCELEQLS